MHIYVSGSMAYDRIMTFPGRFADHIMPEKIHMLNIAFTVTGLVERPGGTAGNIAYALSLLGEQPTIMATIGRDYQPYFDWLSRNGISTGAIRVIEEELTACAYITTDQSDNQITGFNPGAMKHPSLYPVDDIGPASSIGIIAAGNLQDMAVYRDAFVAKGTPFIFDPGQSITSWEASALAGCLAGAKVLISNDYELEMIVKRTGLSVPEILDRAGAIITTKAEKGSVVITRDGTVTVPAIDRGEAVVDPTGAGDAYRGGLIKGLVQGRDLATCAAMGTVCASYAIEVQGTQGYRFAEDDFDRRLRVCQPPPGSRLQ